MNTKIKRNPVNIQIKGDSQATPSKQKESLISEAVKHEIKNYQLIKDNNVYYLVGTV